MRNSIHLSIILGLQVASLGIFQGQSFCKLKTIQILSQKSVPNLEFVLQLFCFFRAATKRSFKGTPVSTTVALIHCVQQYKQKRKAKVPNRYYQDEKTMYVCMLGVFTAMVFHLRLIYDIFPLVFVHRMIWPNS